MVSRGSVREHGVSHVCSRLVPARPEYLCYTDGACKPGEGAPGGWGFHIRPPEGPPVEGFGKAMDTLAKIMEYRAVAEALAALPDGVRAVVFCDNESLVQNMTKRLAEWSASGFVNVDPLVVESVRRVAASLRDKRIEVRWQWVRAHNGNPGNERADELAAQGARQAKVDLAARRTKR
jgi:ribonuclease HI